ncbi:hypothetical protein [Vibrio coralliilyticus]|uniref:Uncharacterized protein n=1 Tax=Vibrio coralliilyticus TaxID=190893 RepID=A0AAP7DEQ1_9VIBR|nr:hypothetical protein [Vibrio coralliilyticus]NOI32008.1 hypothetical protein [Vibrio coralliilyticus]NOJ25209.1 hypothetical protein [Vibrio coralliilyticus]
MKWDSRRTALANFAAAMQGRDELNFSIPQIGMIMGGSGSGKTSNLERLIGLALENGTTVCYIDTKGAKKRLDTLSLNELRTHGLDGLFDLQERYSSRMMFLREGDEIPLPTKNFVMAVDELDITTRLGRKTALEIKEYLEGNGECLIAVNCSSVLRAILPNRYVDQIDSSARLADEMRY